MNKVRDWGDTLLDYSRSSNEDERVIDFAISTLLSLITETEKSIDWLEVGPGPGTKTLPIAHAVERVAKEGLRSLRLIEPAQIWCDFLRRNCPALLQLGELFEARFEDYARFESKGSGQWHPNFITCFHVLYEPRLTEEFLLYLKRQQQAGRRLLACIMWKRNALSSSNSVNNSSVWGKLNLT
jgi:hypothetical protein